MEITGQIEVIFDTVQVSDKFSKRELVLKTEANTPYPQLISMQITQDKCQLLDLYKVGEEVKIQFNLRGRKWDGPQGTKYFNTVDVWRIERAVPATATTTAQPTVQNTATENTSPIVSNSNDTNEDLPY